eukprot:11609176-Alexandrium_andersonii.AAC.1
MHISDISDDLQQSLPSLPQKSTDVADMGMMTVDDGDFDMVTSRAPSHTIDNRWAAVKRPEVSRRARDSRGGWQGDVFTSLHDSIEDIMEDEVVEKMRALGGLSGGVAGGAGGAASSWEY